MAYLTQQAVGSAILPGVHVQLQRDYATGGGSGCSVQSIMQSHGSGALHMSLRTPRNAPQSKRQLISDAGRVVNSAGLRGRMRRDWSSERAPLGVCQRCGVIVVAGLKEQPGTYRKQQARQKEPPAEEEGGAAKSVDDVKQRGESAGRSIAPRRPASSTASPTRHLSRESKAEAAFFRFSQELGKYLVVMFGTGVILATGAQLTGYNVYFQSVLWSSWCAGVVLGSMIGAGQVLEGHGHARAGPRNVIVTGSTRGLGKALAREFLRSGDNVVIASRSEDQVSATVEELRREVRRRGQVVVGRACDVANSEDVRALAALAVAELGRVDLWVNNAGTNTGAKLLVEFEDAELERIVSTNLTGSLICTREAVRLMRTQPKGGHVFNMDGAGSGGGATPRYAAYGATKCGLRQLHLSLLAETKGTRVGVHTASPGMVLTDLLLSGATLQNKQMFNIVCEQPETVARALVPKMRRVRGTGKAFDYLTPLRVVFALATAWIRRGRWFDAEGRAVYAAEAERLTAWAKGHEKSPITAAMDLVPSSAWVSLFSSSAICAYIMLSHTLTNIR